MNTFESPELTFPAKIMEMTANADILIDKYIDTLAVLETVPDDMEPTNIKPEAIELATLTVNTLMELKVTVTSLFEHSAEMNDRIEQVLKRIKTQE